MQGSWPTVTIPIYPSKMRIPITFSVAFDRCPSVHVALSMIDIDNSKNMRLNCEVAEISTTGCVITVWSWCDSKVWGCHMSWFASDNPTFLCGSVCGQLNLRISDVERKEVYVRFDRPFADIPAVAVALKVCFSFQWLCDYFNFSFPTLLFITPYLFAAGSRCMLRAQRAR